MDTPDPVPGSASPAAQRVPAPGDAGGGLCDTDAPDTPPADRTPGLDGASGADAPLTDAGDEPDTTYEGYVPL